MGPPTAPQQRKGPEQNDPPLAAADSTGRGKTSQPAPPPPTALFIPALGEAWNAQMEGSTRTRSPQTRSRSPQKQQMAAEGGAVTRNSGAVTRNRSRKDDISGGGGGGTRGGGARTRATQSKVSGGGGGGGGTRGGGARARRAGQSEDNSGSSWVVKGGVATRTPPPRKDKGAHARANDDEGALGGNAAVDKECALGGGQSKDNSGGGGGGGGARGGGAKGVIGAAKEKRTRGNDVEEGGWGPTTKKQKRKLPLKRNQPSSTSVDAVLGGDASAAVASGSALEAPADSCVQCTWSLYQSLQTCMPCGRVQEADTDMISLQYPFLNLFTGLVSPFAMVHWMVNRLHSSIVGRSTTHDTIPLLLRTSNSADGVR